MIKNIRSDKKISSGNFTYRNGAEMKVFFPNNIKEYAEKCVQHFNNLSDTEMNELYSGIITSYEEYKKVNIRTARKLILPELKNKSDILSYCTFESMEISGQYDENPSYFIHAKSDWGYIKIIIIDGWKPCVFNNKEYKPIEVYEYKIPTAEKVIVFNMGKSGLRDCLFYSGMFRNSEGESVLEMLFFEGGRKFAEKCAEHIRTMPRNMIETICKGILNQYVYAKNNTDFEMPELSEITDILQYCSFKDADLHYNDEKIPAYIISGETKWNTCLGITIKGDKVLYVGDDKNVSPLLDEDLYRLMRVNDLYERKEITFPESGIYRMAAVAFYEGGKQYHYRCEIDDVRAGDTVIIESYREFKEVKVMDIFEQHESELLLPREEYKFVLKKVQ